MPKMVRKGDLPSKICEFCQKPYNWRKKWARDWDNIRFCSERCKKEGKKEGKKYAREASLSAFLMCLACQLLLGLYPI